VLATPKQFKQFEHQKRMVAAKVEKLRKAAMSVSDRLVGYACTIARNSGDNDRLFGSVSPKDIAAVLNEEGIDVQRRQIELPRPIKALGIYPVPIRLHADITSQIMVWVVSKG